MIPASLSAEAARQAVGRISTDDAEAIASEAYERGQRGEEHSPAGLLAVCLSNPAGTGWRLAPMDLRPTERGAMRGLAMRAHAAGRRAA